jgi:environmental stress-induced protein Ves
MDARVTKVLRWDELEATPWKNGGGSTRGLAAAPADAGVADFDWRVSIADVAADGPFSAFPGVARVIMLIDGPEMVLTVDGRTHRLGLHDALAFPGAAATSCRVPSGPTRDLNLMTGIGRAEGTLRAVAVAGRHEAPIGAHETVLLVALTPGLSLEEEPGDATTTRQRQPGPHPLDQLDSVLGNGPGTVRLSGEGTAAEIRVRVLGRPG